VSKEPGSPEPYTYEPAPQRPFWTAARIVALALVVVIAVSAVGAGMYYYAVSPVPPSRVCNNDATNYPLCTTCSSGQTLVNGTCTNNCTNGATNPPSCNSFQTCSNGANNPPYCNNNVPNSTSFCLAFNFGDAEYSQNTTGWYITLYIQNYCSDRSLTLSPTYVNETNQPSAEPFHIYVNGTTFPGPWTLPPSINPDVIFPSGAVVICMSCAGQVFIPCRIYWITVVVTGSGTSSGTTTTQSRGYGWEC